jgi:pyruvate dehydrogenase E2 component (dihydrolipoamide acetyltransferase)
MFVMKAVTAALEKYPRFNASLDTDAEEIILKHYYHIGIAVDTDRGLLVPVVRDVDRTSVADLSVQLPELVQRTQDGELEPKDMQDGTFTITNVGMLSGTDFMPIINHPQVAILGMARASWQPVVQDQYGKKVIEPRYVLPLILAFDHRVLDGADAARFMRMVIEGLEDPDKLMLIM